MFPTVVLDPARNCYYCYHSNASRIRNRQQIPHSFAFKHMNSELAVMPKVSNYTRIRIEVLDKQGLPPVAILRSLKNEGLAVSLASVTQIVKKLQITGSVANLPRSVRPKKLSAEGKAFIDQQMEKNDEMTSGQIQKKLERYGISVCSSTVRRMRKKLGWTLQKTAYCQLIRAPNKVKRLEYARRALESGDTFECSPASCLEREKFITHRINIKSPSHFGFDTCRHSVEF